MERFLATLVGNVAPCQQRRCWREEIGDEVTAALEHHRILEPKERADWYPCGGSCGGQNDRNVMDEPLPDGRWLAVCGDEEVNCKSLTLSEEDLQRLEVSPAALATWLRRALGASGHVPGFPRHKGVEGLGRLLWEGEDREALLALGGARDGLRRLLDERGRQRLPTLVLVPSRVGLDGDLLASHPPDSLVALADLRELVALEGGQLVLVPARSGHRRVLTVREPTVAPYGAEPIVAEVIDSGGKRPLTAQTRRALEQGCQAFDLFIDLTAPGKRRGVRAGRRDDQGVFVEKELTLNEAAILLELVQKRRALRCRDFSVQASAVTRAFERARKKVDVPVTRYRWRAFQTQGGSEPAAKRFLFDPPEGFTFAVIVPCSS